MFILYFLAKFPNPLHFITLNLDPIALVCFKKSSSMFGNFCVRGRFCVQHMSEDFDPGIKCHNVLGRLRDLSHMFRLYSPFFQYCIFHK